MRTLGLLAASTTLLSPTLKSMAIITIEPETSVFVQRQEPIKKTSDTTYLAMTSKKPMALFSGLAQASAQLGQVLTTNNKKEKQQGILNLISTAFSTAAQMVGPEQNQQNNNQEVPLNNQNTHAIAQLVELSNLLINEIQKPTTKGPLLQLPRTLELIKNQTSNDDKNAIVEAYLLFPETAELFISDLINTLQTYIQNELNTLFADLKKDILDH
jgi:hypothetical protein